MIEIKQLSDLRGKRLDEIYAFRREFDKIDNPSEFEKDLDSWLENGAYLYLAYDPNEDFPIGFYHLRKFPDRGDRDYYIDMIASGRPGTGRAMIEYIKNFIDRIRGSVSLKSVDSAYGFYEKMGFTQYKNTFIFQYFSPKYEDEQNGYLLKEAEQAIEGLFRTIGEESDYPYQFADAFFNIEREYDKRAELIQKIIEFLEEYGVDRKGIEYFSELRDMLKDHNGHYIEKQREQHKQKMLFYLLKLTF